ncbi:unnamed protein product [Brassica oleracea]|uniref:(rape) hypothetical protein n=1 Tax=Brassica napus TaxID=3708 RepID=A0A816KEK9_BRANA|nr:unnamed protein product [Brassica napus]
MANSTAEGSSHQDKLLVANEEQPTIVAPSPASNEDENMVTVQIKQPSIQIKQPSRKRGRSARLSAYVTSQRTLTGANSRKRNISSKPTSPARSQGQKRAFKAGNSRSSKTASSTAPPRAVIVPAISEKRKDFHDPLPQGP